MSTDLYQGIIQQISDLLEPLQRAAEVPEVAGALLSYLGVPGTFDTTPVTTAIASVVDLKSAVENLATQESPSFDSVLTVLQKSASVFDALRALDAAGGPTAALAGLGRDLADVLVCQWLLQSFPVIHHIATLLTLIQPESEQNFAQVQNPDGTVVRYAYRIERPRLDRIATLLRDPVGTLRAAYATPLLTGADADAMADALFPKVVALLRELGISCRYGINPGDESLLADSAPLMSHALIIYLNDPLQDLSLEAGVVVSLSSADRGDLGLVLNPFGSLQDTRFAGPFTIDIDLTAGIGAVAVGRHGLTLVSDSGVTQVTGSVSATLPVSSDGPGFIIGSPTGTRVEVGGAQLKAQMSLAEDRQTLALSADVTHSTVVIASGDNDSFIAELLPADGLRTDFSLGLTWSNETGLTLRGSAGMDATLPIGLSVAGVLLSSIHVGLHVDDTVETEISASLSAGIGPITAALDRVGIEGVLSFPQGGGNLGSANLDIHLKPPSGVGLSVDARGVLTGGGFLFHDANQQIYAGVLQLSLHEEITLTAFGLISTRMPDGSRGYSLIIFITAEGFQPIPLGLGFTLLGIGGMVAVNRTFSEDALRQGMKNDTLATLLFPPNPTANPGALIQSLATAFPAKQSSYLLGVLVKIGWFTPTLVLLDLALIFEFGARERLLALGRVSAQLPSADNDLIRINLDAVGVVDFDADTIAIDAVLVDSRLAHRFPITGGAALRAGWSSGPGSAFVLAVGGLNPRFTPPAGFPSLQRLAIALSSGNNPRLTCEAYFALTANTAQFGAHASLYAAAAGFSFEGDVGFDVLLLQIAPPRFIADFTASVALKRGSTSLFSVEFDGTLQGVQPLALSGKAHFKILFFHFSVHFNATLVSGDPPPGPPAVDIKAQLIQALSTSTSWSTQRSTDQPHGVVLRGLPPSGDANAPLVLDPFGQLVVKQQVAPLNTARDIDTYGGAPVTGDRRFSLGATLGGTPLSGQAVQEDFAPAQYFVMSDDQKLSAPSFESMDAGYVFGSSTTKFDPAQVIAAPVGYDTVVIGAPPSQTAAPQTAAVTAATPAVIAADSVPPPYTMTSSQLQAFSPSGAAGRAPLRRVGRARFRNSAVIPTAQVKPPQWAIVPRGNGAPASLDPSVRTWSEYQAALNTLNRAGANWQLVPLHEVPA